MKPQPAFNPPRVPVCPPGFFDWTNLLWIGAVTFGSTWCAVWAYVDAVSHSNLTLALQVGALTLNLSNAYNFVRIWTRLWRKWRIKRAELLAKIEEARQLFESLEDRL